MTLNKSAKPVEIQFDADQEFQKEAIKAIVDLFKGQTLAPSMFEAPGESNEAKGTLFSPLGIGNNVILTDEQIASNLFRIQEHNDIPALTRGSSEGAVALESRDFSVEMETGTGKTYVYLRTAIELNQEYGFTKFVIVVPSVAIREGVEQNLTLLKEHFAGLYGGVQYDVVKYDSTDLSRLRGFAMSNTMQILIMNIDAFNKKDINRINVPQDSMMGQTPIDFVRACQPIVILDEPQNMESDTAKNAIASLNPAVTLRYSATHRKYYHQVYRLTPAEAYELNLVKRISVWSVTEELNGNMPHIKVLRITPRKASIVATIEVATMGHNGLTKKRVPVTGGSKPTDLKELTGLDNYDGYVVEEIDSANGYVEFANGVVVEVGDVTGASRDEIQRTQIKTTVEEHLDRELDLSKRVQRGEIAPTKVLSLFFIDRVANYAPDGSKFRDWFEADYATLAAKPKYADLGLPEVQDVHDGYFAQDPAGNAKNSTTGTTDADNTAYEKIMRNKQLLLSMDEPLRFIFSHSALREGWDNPNVFTICTLNESVSEMKKRQEIGRGLRLPVSADGTRCDDPDVAILTIVANEAYEEFATTLQQEIESDTSTVFAKRNIGNAREKKQPIALRKDWDSDLFKDLWDRIKHKTTYRVQYGTADLIQQAAKRLSEKPKLVGAKIQTKRATIEMSDAGVSATLVQERSGKVVTASYPIPDLLGNLTKMVPVSRSTIAQILINSGRLGEVTVNPQQFIDDAKDAIEQALATLLVNGIQYQKRGTGPDAVYEMSLFLDRELMAELKHVHPIKNASKSPYEGVVYDSDLELEIAMSLDIRDEIKMFLKLPHWFKIETPVGRYNPDWAYIKQEDDGTEKLYLVRESKPTQDTTKLRPSEKLKVDFGRRHFEALDVDFDVIDSASQI